MQIKPVSKCRFLWLVGSTAFVALLVCNSTSYAQTAKTVAPAVEYENLPMSSRDFQVNMKHSQLIARGHIVEYKPPQMVDHHVSDVDFTTIEVSETYVGSVPQGSKVTYLCICKHESAPSQSSLLGHDVIVFLNYNPVMHTWEPATANYQLFFHPEIRRRIRRYSINRKR